MAERPACFIVWIIGFLRFQLSVDDLSREKVDCQLRAFSSHLCLDCMASNTIGRKRWFFLWHFLLIEVADETLRVAGQTLFSSRDELGLSHDHIVLIRQMACRTLKMIFLLELFFVLKSLLESIRCFVEVTYVLQVRVAVKELRLLYC